MDSPMCSSPAPPPPGTPYHGGSSAASSWISGCSSARRGSHEGEMGRTPKEKVTPVCPRYFVAPSRPGKRSSRASSLENMILGGVNIPSTCDPTSMGFPAAAGDADAMATEDEAMAGLVAGDDLLARAPAASAPTLRRSSSAPDAMHHLRASSAPEQLAPSPPLAPAQYATIAEGMVARGVRILAIDWDATFLSCHTHSCWSGTARDLLPWIRSECLHLVRAALHRGVHVAVVTFSSQTHLVREALHLALPLLAHCIDVKGNDQR